MTPTPRLLAVLLSLLGVLSGLVLTAAARAEAAYTIGMSEQKPAMWQDSRFQALGFDQVRLIVAWDLVLKGDFSRYDEWMAAAQARGADVLLAVNHSTTSHTRLPTLGEYRTVIRALRERYPHVRTMSAWNEANHWTQPTHRNPRRAAQYYNLLRSECRGCKLVAADVLDQSGLERWLKTFRRHAVKPRIWGLHNYSDANRFRATRRSGTARFLKMVPGEIWLTEAGGIVRFGPFKGGRSGEARAARATRHTFALARLSSRIKRVYLYHWNAEPRFITWDSGLVAADGRARPALDIVRREVNRVRARRGLPAVGPLPVSLGG